MDETPIWYEMNYKKTIESIGNKNAHVKIFNCYKLRISLILTILSNGTKLAPLVVFKGKTGVPLEKELQNDIIMDIAIILKI